MATGEGRHQTSDVDLALCRATLWSALALGFRGPTDETVERLTSLEAVGALAQAARLLDALPGSPLPLGEGQGEGGRRGPMLETHVLALAQRDATLGRLAAEHRRLFGHTVRGEVPPYETEYGNEALFQQPQELGDLAGFLRAFGLTLRAAAHERIDHVSCECELLAFLACKEAYASECGDEEMRAATLRATRLFLRDHVGRFASTFAHRLGANDPGGFYAALGRLLLALVEAECARHCVPIGPQALGLRPDPAACAAPMGCAAAEGGTCGAGE